jgi:hypothetical protein
LFAANGSSFQNFQPPLGEAVQQKRGAHAVAAFWPKFFT